MIEPIPLRNGRLMYPRAELKQFEPLALDTLIKDTDNDTFEIYALSNHVAIVGRPRMEELRLAEEKQRQQQKLSPW